MRAENGEPRTKNQTPAYLSAQIALYMATVAVYADMYITQPILPVLSHEFGIAPASAGLTVSMVVLAIALASSAYGSLSDMFGRKPVMVLSCGLLALPTLLCGLTTSFSALLFFRALQGLLIPGVTAVAVAYIGDQFRDAEVGSVVGSFIGATVAGGLLGRVVSGIITELASWRATFLAFAAWTLLGALAMGYALPRQRRHAPIGWASAYRGMFQHFRDRRLVGAFIIGGGLFFAFIGVFTYLPYYLTAAPFRLSTGLVSSVYVVYLAGVIVAPLAGRLSARFTRRAIMATGLIIAGIGVAGTMIGRLAVIVPSLVVLCIGMFTAQSTAPAFVNATAREAKGGAGALYLTFYYIGATIGSVLPGYAWQAWGWAGMVMVCAIALMIALLADWMLCAEQ